MLYLEANKEWTRVLKDYEIHRSWAEGLQKPGTAESTERTEVEQEKFRAGNKAQDRSMALRCSLLASWTYTYS